MLVEPMGESQQLVGLSPGEQPLADHHQPAREPGFSEERLCHL
jgi:hypothetical protein